jgi:hypothetical protein
VVDDEGYWERNCRARWKNCVLNEHGGLWKRMYVERNLAEVIEKLDFTRISPSEFEETLRISAPHTVSLQITQVITHLDLQKVLTTLTRLSSLRICFTVRRVGLDFDWSLFGIRFDDAARLSAGLRTTPSLSSLELSRCMLDDDCTRKLSEGLAMNSTVTHLSTRTPTVFVFYWSSSHDFSQICRTTKSPTTASAHWPARWPPRQAWCAAWT